MRKLCAALFIYLGLASAALAQAWVVPSTQASIPISITTATTTKLIDGIANKLIYITAFDVVASSTGNFQLISGTGATCGSGTVNLTGNYNFTAQAGIARGTGNGALIVVGAGLNVCAVTSAAVTMAGSMAYALF